MSSQAITEKERQLASHLEALCSKTVSDFRLDWKDIDSLLTKLDSQRSASEVRVLVSSHQLFSLGRKQPLLQNMDDGRLSVRAQYLAIMYSWRTGKNIYRFDDVLYDALTNTGINKDVLGTLFYRLPNWCVYIVTPSLNLPKVWGGSEVQGFFSMVDTDPSGHLCLRLLIDAPKTSVKLIPVKLAIHKTIDEIIAEHIAQNALSDHTKSGDVVAQMPLFLTQLLCFLMYLCIEEPDVPRLAYEKPLPTRTRHQGFRFFPPSKANVWAVGTRLGAALRAAYQRQPSNAERTSPTEVRPHIRRAHYHLYWVGMKGSPGGQSPIVKWLPPIPVNMDVEAAMPTVVHNIQQT